MVERVAFSASDKVTFVVKVLRLLQLQLQVAAKLRTRLSFNHFYPSNPVSTTEGVVCVSRVIHWTYVQDMALCL